jgi:multidrug efflux pump subunit AcrA (membrane-fusion protein)
VIAPFAGRVLNLDVNVGQVVNNGTTLGTVYAVDEVEVRLPLKQSDLVHLKLPESYRDLATQASEAKIPVELMATMGGKTHSWDGELVRVEGTIDAQTRQLYVVVVVKDPYKFREDGTPPLKIGQFVNALIKAETLEDVVVLPRAAVSSANHINVISNDVLNRVPIEPLWMNDSHVVISNQFEAGQLISTTPLGDVVSGTAVQIIKEGAVQSNEASADEKKPAGKRRKKS